MGLTRHRLGDLIQQRREKYDGTDVPVRGVTRDGFISPKQKVDDLRLYNLFYKDDFVFNPARMEINSIALNTDIEKGACSSLYEIFFVKRPDIVLPAYLNLFIKRNEFARMCAYIGWGSAREYCRVENISDIQIDLPSIEIQRKYVDVYNAMVENQKCYERSLKDLKLACDAEVESLLRREPRKKLGPYIERYDKRNKDNSIRNVKGVSTSKEFRAPTAKVDTSKLQNYKIVHPRQISFVQTTNNEKVLSSALNLSDEDIVVTSVNEVFSTDETRLLPEYLELFFLRKEFDRYARFHSWGSARETFTWADMQNVQIPIPELKVQRALADIFIAYNERKEISKRMRVQIKEICPILIKGSLEEANKS